MQGAVNSTMHSEHSLQCYACQSIKMEHFVWLLLKPKEGCFVVINKMKILRKMMEGALMVSIF
jgi:hypothetical protein